jgi:C-terminal processing protease CtpA/Prc
VDAAFVLARTASRVVLDLRANGGGDPAAAIALARI